MRRVSKEVLKRGREVLPLRNEVSDKWNFEKDGKSYFHHLSEKELRK